MSLSININDHPAILGAALALRRTLTDKGMPADEASRWVGYEQPHLDAVVAAHGLPFGAVPRPSENDTLGDMFEYGWVASYHLAANVVLAAMEGRTLEKMAIPITITPDLQSALDRAEQIAREMTAGFVLTRKKYASAGPLLAPIDTVYAHVSWPDAETVIMNEIAGGLAAAGAPASMLYAYRVTGRLVTEENLHLVDADDLAEWENAVTEGTELMEKNLLTRDGQRKDG